MIRAARGQGGLRVTAAGRRSLGEIVAVYSANNSTCPRRAEPYFLLGGNNDTKVTHCCMKKLLGSSGQVPIANTRGRNLSWTVRVGGEERLMAVALKHDEMQHVIRSTTDIHFSYTQNTRA